MGSRPSKVSPSMLGMHSQVGRDHSGVLSNISFTSKSPIVPLTRRSSDSHGAIENGFTTPRSRGRSAIYNMARTPYSRGHQTSIVRVWVFFSFFVHDVELQVLEFILVNLTFVKS